MISPARLDNGRHIGHCSGQLAGLPNSKCQALRGLRALTFRALTFGLGVTLLNRESSYGVETRGCHISLSLDGPTG